MSDLAREARHLTFEGAAEAPAGVRGELEGGRLVPMTRSTWRHGEIVARVTVLLGMYVKQHPGWSLSAGDPGAKLSRDPDTLRGPDVGIVRVERRPSGQGVAGWLEGAPNVAVEVVGDSQGHSELAKKALEYLAAGAKAVWVVDPEPRRVVVYTPPSSVAVLGADDELDAGDALPGFRCRVAELFE